MALIAAHLNAGHSGGDSVAIGIYSSSPSSIPPSPLLPVPKKPVVSVDVKHHVYLLRDKTEQCHGHCVLRRTPTGWRCQVEGSNRFLTAC